MNATGGEVFNKTWWDAVDYIGVDGTYSGGEAGGAEEKEKERSRDKSEVTSLMSVICVYQGLVALI